MSSREPDPDDEDTGPLHVAAQTTPPPGSSPGMSDARPSAAVSVNPRPVQRNRGPVVPIGIAAATVIVLGVLAWVFWPSPGGGTGNPATDNADASATPSTLDAQSRRDAELRLLSMLPPGYADGVCEAVAPTEGVLAQVSCGRNGDTGGPLTATYTLVEDDEAMKELFDGVVARSSVVDCPGNIQSPGPWRRNATPQQVAGTLVCGFQQSKPTVAWTTDADLMVSQVQSGPQGPNMVQLYTWWSSHS